MKDVFHVPATKDWHVVAKKVASFLHPGMILGLSGSLGSGKTTFVQYLARELGAETSPKSPTFSLLRVHTIKKPYATITRLVHVDAYRLEKPEDILSLDLDEELSKPGTLMVIEWPEQAQTWLKRHQEHYREMKVETEGEGRKVTWFETLHPRS